MPTRLPMLVMTAGLMLANASLGRGQPVGGQPDEATLERLRAAKTVRLEVIQRYARGEMFGDDEEADVKAVPL